MLEQINQKEYSILIEKFKNKPFSLTCSWIDYLNSKGNELLYFVDSKVQPKIICWARVKKIMLIGKALSVGGPIYFNTVSVKQLTDFLIDLRSLKYKGFYLNPNTLYSTFFEIALRNAMFKRPIGQSSTSLTIRVNLNDNIPKRNWRRNIKKALGENFRYEVKKELSLEDCYIIELLHAENAKIRKLKDSLKVHQIKKLVNNKNNIFVWFLYKNDRPIAVRIISIDDIVSFDVFACNSLESRKNGANHYLMQKIFDYLKNKGIEYFDFSRIPVGKIGENGIYEFKNSSGGKVVLYNGEWVYFKKSWFRHLQYLYESFNNKREFY